MDNRELEEMAKKVKDGTATTEEQTVFYQALDQLLKSTEALINKKT